MTRGFDQAEPTRRVSRDDHLSRRERLRRDRRRRWYVVVIASVSGSLAALSSGPSSAPAAREPERGTETTVEAPAEGKFSTLLLAHRAKDGTLDLGVIFGVDTNEPRRATALLLPPTTMVQVAALQQQTLRELPALVDDDILELTVENATGIRLDTVIIADDVLLARLLAPADPIPVDFSRGIRIDDDAGTLGYAGGAQKLSAADAYRVLLGTEPDGSLSHLVTVGAVLEGWIDRLDRPAVARPTVEVDRRATFLRAMGGLDLRLLTLPVERVDAGDVERFRMLDDEVANLVGGQFGPARLGDGSRPRAELRNGTGTVGLTQAVSRFVVPIGVEVAHTDNVPGFGKDETIVQYYDGEHEATAQAVVDALGVGRAERVNEQIDFVDLTVIVGADFETAHPEVTGR